MTPDAVRALDGPALSRLAWELGLGPTTLEVMGEGWWDPIAGCYWEPHVNLHQARDVFFDGLRALGLHVWVFATATHGFAHVARPHVVRALCFLKWPDDVGTEAHALLLVSVLAVLADQKKQ